MKRRKFIKAVGASAGVSTLAGCTFTSQNGTDNAAGTEATAKVIDDVLYVEGEAWYLCHSGITETLVVVVEVLVDGEVYDSIQKTISAPRCGVEYEYSVTYNIDNIDAGWDTLSANAVLVERR